MGSKRNKAEIVEAAKNFAIPLKFSVDGSVLADVDAILAYLTRELNDGGEANVARLARVVAALKEG